MGDFLYICFMSVKKPNRNPNTTCDVCGKPIYRRPNLLLKNKTKSCSHSCNRKIYAQEYSIRAKLKCNLPVMYGEKNPSWKGGVTMFKKKGNYINVRYVRCPKEYIGMARKDGYVMEHRLFIAIKLGRVLNRTECVHHIDHNPNNNEVSNLLLFPCNRSHKFYEGMENGNGKNGYLGFHNQL